jgi:hypothetical protein
MMNANGKRLLGWIVLSIIVTMAPACSSTGTTEVPPEEGVTPAVTTAVPPTAEPTEASKMLIEVPGVEEITLTTPEEGAGVKPQFAWEPVDGAARYTLVLYTAGGDPYWAWDGAATSVYLGGSDTEPREDSAGPVLSPGMSWAVMAFDGDNRLIGSSVLRPISPGAFQSP